jgi:predicted aconitase
LVEQDGIVFFINEVGENEGWILRNFEDLEIKLTEDEVGVLQGHRGPTMQRVLQTLVIYGEALGAERLVELSGDGHFVISWATPGIAPSFELLDELVDAGLKTELPFTLDPSAPLDFENWQLRPDQEASLSERFRDQARYDERMLQLGLRDREAYTCNPFGPEVKNIPEKGMILAWSESACAIYANSVLGARTNKNGAIIDLLSYVAGKTPLAGLLTEEGRRANSIVEINTNSLPDPQTLGAVIGSQVLDGVPYIVGLDRFLDRELSEATVDYLREMGAGCATYSAIALFHVENITPEALEQGRDLLLSDHNQIKIDDEAIHRFQSSLLNDWNDPDARPEKCFIGCPHLSTRQLKWWTGEILARLESQNKDHLSVNTTICAAPGVLGRFKSDQKTFKQLMDVGVRFSHSCPETLFEGGVSRGDAVITNSCKLNAYTATKYFPDEELIEILVGR